MKKTVLKTVAVLLIAVTFSACSALKGGSNTISRGKISGDWGITAVSLQGLLDGSVQSAFNTAPYKCFENSIWKLTNSGKGSFTINNPATGCPVGTTQNFYWSFPAVQAGRNFSLKNCMIKINRRM